MMGYMMRHPALVGRVSMMGYDEAPRPGGQGVDDGLYDEAPRPGGQGVDDDGTSRPGGQDVDDDGPPLSWHSHVP